MNCPVCNRSWATALSVCPSCGSDIFNDEIQVKKPSGVAPRFEGRPKSAPTPEPPAILSRPMFAPPPPAERRVVTAGLSAPKTSPTLVGFQNQNASLPDWRLQLQNAVQQRKGAQNIAANAGDNTAQFPTDGATALKMEIATRVEKEAPPQISDPIVAKAMRRIEESRKAFLEPEVTPGKPVRERPFGVVAPTGKPSVPTATAHGVPPTKPRLVVSAASIEKRDTNKLPPMDIIPPVKTDFVEPLIQYIDTPVVAAEFAEIGRIRIKAENAEIETAEISGSAADEIEDLAPFSMRFGAGLFDLIIGLFATMLLLSPVAFTRGDWFSLTGLLTFAGASALVLFLYMTICLGFFGKTMGMRLFSLELVDAVENEYPSLRQAAVNSSIFLLLLGFGGVGFLTIFYNEEKRALHDLLSGTILVREF